MPRRMVMFKHAIFLGTKSPDPFQERAIPNLYYRILHKVYFTYCFHASGVYWLIHLQNVNERDRDKEYSRA
jgi:hypothetical protein